MVVHTFSLEKQNMPELTHHSLTSLFLETKADFYRCTLSVGLLENLNSSLLLWPSHKVSMGTVRRGGPHKAVMSHTGEKE